MFKVFKGYQGLVLFVVTVVFFGQTLFSGKTMAAFVDSQETVETSPSRLSFRNDVQPILTKRGCNSGACHGAAAGKGGFKLSLRGYDTPRDYLAITRDARGRRIELADPGRSLLLAKPSGAIRHKGGLRFEVDSNDYHMIATWIAQGAQPPRDKDPQVVRLTVKPDHIVLQPGTSESLRVQAHFDDGSTVDVTRWSMFTSTNEIVAKVDESGLTHVHGHGEGAVSAWYQSRLVMARVSSPYAQQVPRSVHEQAVQANFIDRLNLAKLRELNLAPSPRSSDAEFLRRVYLDTIGTLPTANQTREFLADRAMDKRNQLIDQLLNSKAYVDYWSYKWSDVFLVDSRRLHVEAVDSYYAWIRGNVESNTPWDEFVRAVVLATGSSQDNGATCFYAVHQDPENLIENVSKAFLGLSIACAKCHNHPLEKWTNDQYYAMANLFARVRSKGSVTGGNDQPRILYVVDKGELIQPLSGKPQPPAPLDGTPIPFDATEDRRIHLANWLTSPENPYFSRAITNRIWANFLGVGLVEPVDDLRVTNPASHEELLTAAARYLIDHQFDLKALMRVILWSELYQRTSQPVAENVEEQRFYARYYPRRLMAEILLDAVSQVTEVPTVFNQITVANTRVQETKAYPIGTRAIELRDAAVVSYFLTTFGRNERAITCECERSNEPSMVQVMHIHNGNTINEKLQAEKGRITRFLQQETPDELIVEEAYLSMLSRYPTDAERAGIVSVLAESSSTQRRAVIEDIYWAIMSSREFLFNH